MKFLDFALVTDDVIKVFDDLIIFETFVQVIFITYSQTYQVSWVFNEKNWFYSNFSATGQKALPPLKSSKKPTWDRVNENSLYQLEGYNLLHQNRKHKNVGGVAICQSSYSFKKREMILALIVKQLRASQLK